MSLVFRYSERLSLPLLSGRLERGVFGHMDRRAFFRTLAGLLPLAAGVQAVPATRELAERGELVAGLWLPPDNGPLTVQRLALQVLSGRPADVLELLENYKLEIEADGRRVLESRLDWGLVDGGPKLVQARGVGPVAVEPDYTGVPGIQISDGWCTPRPEAGLLRATHHVGVRLVRAGGAVKLSGEPLRVRCTLGGFDVREMPDGERRCWPAVHWLERSM